MGNLGRRRVLVAIQVMDPVAMSASPPTTGHPAPNVGRTRANAAVRVAGAAATGTVCTHGPPLCTLTLAYPAYGVTMSLAAVVTAPALVGAASLRLLRATATHCRSPTPAAVPVYAVMAELAPD